MTTPNIEWGMIVRSVVWRPVGWSGQPTGVTGETYPLPPGYTYTAQLNNNTENTIDFMISPNGSWDNRRILAVIPPKSSKIVPSIPVLPGEDLHLRAGNIQESTPLRFEVMLIGRPIT